MCKILNKSLPIRLRNRIESEDHGKKPYEMTEFNIEMTDSDFEEQVLRDPQKRKLMVWLLPSMKNKTGTKRQIKEALKMNKISKADLFDLINKNSVKHDFSGDSRPYRYEEYSEDNSLNLSKPNLKLLTIREDKKGRNSQSTLGKNSISKTSNPTLPKKKPAQTLGETPTTKGVPFEPSSNIRQNLTRPNLHQDAFTENKHFTMRNNEQTLTEVLNYVDAAVKLPEISKFALMKKKAKERFENFYEFQDNLNSQMDAYFKRK